MAEEKEKRITQIIIDKSLKPQSNLTNNALPLSKIPRLKKRLPQPKVLVTSYEAPTVDTLFKQHPSDPWEKYTEIMKILHFEGEVSLAIRKASPRMTVCIREFPEKEAQKTLFSYEQLHHINIASVIEAFCTPQLLYIVFERTHFCLEQMIKCPLYPTKEQIAATVGQVSGKPRTYFYSILLTNVDFRRLMLFKEQGPFTWTFIMFQRSFKSSRRDKIRYELTKP
jgi:hypothetical protein